MKRDMDFAEEYSIIPIEASEFCERVKGMNQVFSNNLKKFRQQKNYTQEQVAERLGVSVHTVSRWECGVCLPDVTLLPQLGRLYCVSVDDFFKESSVAYENYAQRLASVYEETRNPEDFMCADHEFRKRLRQGACSTEDLRIYGIIHHFMMQYAADKAIELFDRVIEQGPACNEEVFWKTKTQKMRLYSQLGRSKESITSCLEDLQKDSENVGVWRCLIEAYLFDGDVKNAKACIEKAIVKYPNDAILYTLGGDVYEKLGAHDEALRCWDQAIELDDAILDAKYSKLDYYLQIGEKDRSYQLMLEIVGELKKAGLDIEAAGEEKRLKERITRQ